MTLSIRPTTCVAVLAALLFTGITGAGTQLILESDFDDLSVGTAPDNEEDAGPWTITYTSPDVPLEFREDYPEILTIVPTATFAAGIGGNSLRVESKDANTQTTHFFDKMIFEDDVDFVRASFDVYIPDLGDGRRSAPFIFLGSKDSTFALAPEERGPVLAWDARGRLRSNIPANLGVRRTVVSDTPLDEWQHVQLDIDLVNDTYDIFWSAGDSDPQLVKSYQPFELDTDQTSFDRIEIATFPIENASADPTGVGYVDNIRIEAINVDWIGDANLDGEFNSSDLVTIFEAGLFETGDRAAWSQGDWNGDRLFDSGDLVASFQDGGYEMGPRDAVTSVPEPSGIVGVVLFVFLALRSRPRRLFK